MLITPMKTGPIIYTTLENRPYERANRPKTNLCAYITITTSFTMQRMTKDKQQHTKRSFLEIPLPLRNTRKAAKKSRRLYSFHTES